MTEAERQQREIALSKCGGRCEVCGKEMSRAGWQGAHRIANTVNNRRKWGDIILDHPMNIAIVCSLGCNQLCNIGNNPGKCWELAYRIAEYEKRRYECVNQ